MFTKDESLIMKKLCRRTIAFLKGHSIYLPSKFCFEYCLCYLHAQVRANVGVVTESTSDLHQCHVSDGEEKGSSLNSEYRSSVRFVSNGEYPSNETQAETVYLITETSLVPEPNILPSGSSVKSRDGENRGRSWLNII